MYIYIHILLTYGWSGIFLTKNLHTVLILIPAKNNDILFWLIQLTLPVLVTNLLLKNGLYQNLISKPIATPPASITVSVKLLADEIMNK